MFFLNLPVFRSLCFYVRFQKTTFVCPSVCLTIVCVNPFYQQQTKNSLFSFFLREKKSLKKRKIKILIRETMTLASVVKPVQNKGKTFQRNSWKIYKFFYQTTTTTWRKLFQHLFYVSMFFLPFFAVFVFQNETEKKRTSTL